MPTQTSHWCRHGVGRALVLALPIVTMWSCQADRRYKAKDPETVDTGTETRDTTTTTETTTGATTVPWEWTEGPAVPECTASTNGGPLVALSGVVLLPEGPTAGHVVYDRTQGTITCAGADCDPSGATVVCTEGVISPGLIDTHDHLQYNVLGQWQHSRLYTDRYEWQSDGEYWDFREAYDEIEDDYVCEIMKWAELRVLVSGGTSAVGSSGGSCIQPLIRNLDEGVSEHFVDGYDLAYSSGNVGWYDNADGQSYRGELDDGELSAALNHVSEGISGSVRGEIDHMFDVDMVGPGQVFVHATDASTHQLAQMAETRTGIIWSPRSNLDLYGQTTPADVAIKMGVPVALGPDWTWSGSHSLTGELECATEVLRARNTPLRDRDVWAMSTHTAAEILGLESVLGALEPGLQADIAVFAYSGQPYRDVIEAESADVQFVAVSGKALFGQSELMTGVAENANWCETVSACGTDRTLCVQSAANGDAAQTAADLEATLSAALASTPMPSQLEYANDLLGLFACDQPKSCDPSAPSAGDEDGDGVVDTEDKCAAAYDPQQLDHDNDGVGDACDPCPLVPDSNDCAHHPDDIDDDGRPSTTDNCPTTHNPGQEDGDGDQVGDVCDLCPDEANPGGGACTIPISSLRNPAAEDHPAIGTPVNISGVVTAVSDSGFYVQEPDATEYGGIFVYDQGDGGVSRGDLASVTGVYTEYYDLSEVDAEAVAVTGSATVPSPIEVSACDVGTGGPQAEKMESMLITVEDVTVSDDNPDSSDYGEMVLEGCLRVDDQLFDGYDRTVGTHYDRISGVLGYSYSHHKLLPRDTSDIQ